MQKTFFPERVRHTSTYTQLLNTYSTRIILQMLQSDWLRYLLSIRQ